MAESSALSGIQIEIPEKPGDTNIADDAVKSITNEIICILQLDDPENKDQIVNGLLENGRQSLRVHQDDIIPDVYADVMNGNDNKLIMLLKKYFQQQWEIQYSTSNEWFISFLKQQQKGENHELYETVLARTAEYGNKYMKDCPILSVVLQLLFEVIDDNYLKETNIFDNLWLTVTNNGLKSITKYSEYIIPDVMNEQLNKSQLELFKALREYYRKPLLLLLEQNKIANRENLYDVALDNVAEQGWLLGIQAIQNRIVPSYYKNLVKNLPAPPPQEPKEKQKSATSHANDDNTTLMNTQSKPTLTGTTTTSNGEKEPAIQVDQSEINQLKTTVHTQNQHLIEETQSATTFAPNAAMTSYSTTKPAQAIDLHTEPGIAQKNTEEYSRSFGNMTVDEKGKKRLDLDDPRHNLATMPSCAEKTIIELRLHFEHKLLEDPLSSQEEETVSPLLLKLEDQVKKQELLSEEIRTSLQDLNRIVLSGDCSSVVGALGEFLKNIRSLNMILEKKRKKRLYLDDLRHDLTTMPSCAEKTTMELLIHFEEKLLEDSMASQEEGAVSLSLQKLQDQVKKQELLSEEIKIILLDLNRAVNSGACSSALFCLTLLIKEIIPLYVPEIKRLVKKAESAAELIYEKDIILLVGPTGAGKSTTIQFLAGAKMQETMVEVAPGSYLEHIAVVGPVRNPELRSVTSNPECKSETRYIAPVAIPLKEIFGPSETGDIILCDAPGFGDRAGPEVDIANGVGIVEALKGCTSVKLLVLSSFKGLGDKAEGIQNLAHLLSKMVKGIEERLDAIFYAFTKYPLTTDVHAHLLNIKQQRIDSNALLRSDSAFVTVIKDMIRKTEAGTDKIDPVRGDRKILIEKLKRATGIEYPGEVFRFPMSEETQKIIANEAQRYELSIKRAEKQKNIDLVLYYLGNLKTLKDLIKNSFVTDAYENSIRFISENIGEYCKEVMRKFNRSLESQDGLREEDVREYKTFVEYIQDIQKPLGEHLKSDLISPALLMQNIDSELQKRCLTLQGEDLHSRLVEIYLGNLRMLKNSFRELELNYSKSCEDFENRFNQLVKSASEPILASEFEKVAEIIHIIFKSSYVLKNHLGEKVEEKYTETVKLLLKHLGSFSEKAEPILEKIRLNDSDVKILNEYMEILRSAKETSTLQDRISTYAEMLKKRANICEKNFKNLYEIYNEFIEKILKYFDGINVRIKDLFEKNGDFALEQIEKLVNDMETIRTIPELETKTAGTYYRTVENVRGYMQQLQKDAEQLLVAIDQQSGIINYGHLARSLSRLKNAKWIDRVSPGAYDALMHRITEELLEHAQLLQERLMKLDFHLKCPDKVCVAQEIVEKIESMSMLERSVPELEKYRISIIDRFLQTIQGAFDHIQRTFNLQDRAVYNLKQELKELEQIKREYKNLHPAHKYLQEQEYSDIDQLNREIENLTNRQKEELDNKDVMKREKEKKENDLQDIIQKYMHLTSTNSDKSMMKILRTAVVGESSKGNSQADNYLKEHKYSNIDAVYEAKLNTTKDYDNKLRLIQDNCTELSNSLNRLESIRKGYKSLLLVRSNSISPEEMCFLKEKGQESSESLDAKIQDKKRIISELEKNNQAYNFSDRLNASVANNALVYITHCEKVGHFRVKETAAETNGILQKYVGEYGNFLDQEIDRQYKNTSNIDAEGGLFQYSHDLQMRLQELSSLSRFPDVFQYINGAEKVEHWQREFFDCYRVLKHKMGEYQDSHDPENLSKQLDIVHALSGLDDFCGNKLFSELYEKYKVGMNANLKQIYKDVLQHILNTDYANADMALSDISEKPFNDRALRQIRHDLQSSLTKLMKDTKSKAYWLHGKIERKKDNMDDQIKQIGENIEKIRMALGKSNIMDLLDENTKSNLKKFDADIDQILSETILKGLDSIEIYMDTDNFAEAERGITSITDVQRDLIGYCTSTAVIKKFEELRKRLHSLVDKVLKRNDFKNIENYFVDPPKDLLANLKAAFQYGTRYTQAHSTLLAKIRLEFSEAIDQVHSVRLNERSAKITSLSYALSFVPDELQESFKKHIDRTSKAIEIEEKAQKDEFDSSLNSSDNNDHTITKIGALAKRFKEQKMDEFSEKLHEDIFKRMEVYRTNLESSLDQHDMQSALDIMNKIIKYNEAISSYIPGIKKIYEMTRNSTMKSFENCSKIIAEISKIEKPEIVEQAFSNTVVCVDFSNTLGTTDEFLPKTALQNCSKSLKTMGDYLRDNSEKYRNALETMTIDDLHTNMTISKKWDTLLHQVKHCPTKDDSTKRLLPDVQNVVTHTDMISDVGKEINCLKAQLNVALISDETTRFEPKREEFFSQLKKSISKLKEIDAKLKDVLPIPVNAKESEENLKTKAKRIGEQLLDTASKSELTPVECAHFRKYYEHLLAFDKHLSLPDVDAQSSIDTSKAKVFEKVTCLSKEFAGLGTNGEKAVETLIKMKEFAENLSMFDTEINARVDEALETYKRKSGPTCLNQLTMELQKTNIGVRIMSEHSALKGEDWRRRREKMQNQDNLVYILGLLEGDDLDKNVLETRYLTFRKKYDNLLSSNLVSHDQTSEKESSLDALISNTKFFVDKVAPNTTSLTLNQSFKDKVPELLAHIFAIWTLQNTEYYNAAHGIESRDAYLLMPHVAQVIAIFRILGIGYENSGSSKNLFNNLVQIGTGEGKSVVMAVTACVFALIGVDVNCSCYSEVLSVRDKKSFASLFGALGIQEHIEYGTFNKLCENLLNEQCNVREKVRDMILKNKNALDAVETIKRIRPKVLLIDEVDVFLSEKYYGGIYNPAVHLKHPVIKSLLDTIWGNRTIRTLNGIQTLPAYQECANQFSNWTFLLDEAVKDMIVALQSFQSSTYLVQNDRIVYVDGQSIAENVVRGYDTIWAYYHENKNNKISSSSLEANVGIIVNCGTFSYAEMPHEFAYITGVTGTLKTLAKPEKEILAKVYAVHKNTYMPSVFGSCMRTYDCKAGVRAINETEYFMAIRNEIDRMCIAKRAILVFFESEDKLMAFYNSSTLLSIKEGVSIITEQVSVKNRKLYIKCAATIGKVTLLTRTFGRGTDFICSNKQLLAYGGIHVLQTFFSEELSEEYQIMGRGARQGDVGSYGMILLKKDLEWVLGSSWADKLLKIGELTLYENLNEARNALYESKCGAKGLGVDQCKREHNASKDFMAALNSGNIGAVQEFLKKQNQGANLIKASSRTVLLMDATGSMSGLLTAAKETVCTMFERATDILSNKKLASDAFQLQFVVYRDYDCKEDGILQSSSWETKPNNLRNFMTHITPMGGGDYEEAIEIGLWHAVQQSEEPDGISQVILIGDAPAKERPAIARDRNACGGEAYWSKTKYKTPTYYKDELQKLKAKNIPVHAFYLVDGAKENFQRIAGDTGRCELLHINFSQGAEFLTHCVTKEILRDKEGEAAVNRYIEKYVKQFTS